MSKPPLARVVDGLQRSRVEVLGYLFFIGDRKRTPFLYRAEPDASGAWLRLRNEESVIIPDLLQLAEAAQERFGFRDFNLKGTVFSGKFEMEAVVAERFPQARITLDPNGAWPIGWRFDPKCPCLTHGKSGSLAYVPDCVARLSAAALKMTFNVQELSFSEGS
jgi:glucarate dehydratase